MNYDQTIRQAEQIITSLEQAEALSVTEYQQKAKEVNRLLDQCEAMLRDMHFVPADCGLNNSSENTKQP